MIDPYEKKKVVESSTFKADSEEEIRNVLLKAQEQYTEGNDDTITIQKSVFNKNIECMEAFSQADFFHIVPLQKIKVN